MGVVYIEADGLEAALAGIGGSQGPFDVWFPGLAREVHGIDLEDGFQRPEQGMEASPGSSPS